MQTRDPGRTRTLSAFFAAGGGLCFAAPLLPTGPTTDEAGIALVGAVALAVAGALQIRPAAVPTWLLHTAVLAGNLLITGVVLLAGTGASAATWAQLYVWAPVYTAAYCRRGAFLLHLASTVVLHGTALAVLGAAGQAVTRVVVTAATALVVSLVVAMLVARIRTLASTDELTGLANRRAFEDALHRAHAYAVRRDAPLCVAVLDLDEFKQHNDRHGHAHGDRVLREVADAWRGRLRAGDVLGRLGGDEFGLVLPDCGLSDAAAIGRALVAATPPGIGASMGVTGDRSLPPWQMLAAADAALYDAKRGSGPDVVASDADDGRAAGFLRST